MTVKDDFNAKCERSLNAMDIQAMGEYLGALRNLPSSNDGYIDNATLDVVSPGGYLIGEIWWNPEREIWVVDLKNYGEAR